MPTRAPPADGDERAADEVVAARRGRSMGRALDTTDIRDLLYRNLEHPRWDDVADRCLLVRQLHAGLPDLLLQHASRT